MTQEVETWLKEKAMLALGLRTLSQVIESVKSRDLII